MADVCVCGHDRQEHGQERGIYECDNSKRELCMVCPGYEYDDGSTGYPNGKAWHRFKALTAESSRLDA